ncbi:substrate-binding periplasmic protein [Arsukibacterium perlucidum]|uniref:substrate-binding periplasmic protein n=1 Tax=Arsukibacterium perlucidum TaxID=368811 RepID=UPI000376C73C|nr:transporter substrate-binding domain-containing protein [Arsukibacterium perlucidum]
MSFNNIMAVLLSLSLLMSMPLAATNIRVVTEYRSYYQMQNSDGSLGGYATDVVQALFAVTGDTPEFEVNSWGRSYYEAETNNNVLIYSMSFNPERAELFDCVAELDNEELFFWALKDNIKRPLDTLNDLRQYHIAVSIASNPDQYLTAQGLPRLLRTSTPEYALNMLYRNRVDILISVEKSIHYRAQQLGFDPSQLSKVFQLAELNHPLCVAFNRNSDAELRQRYRQAFATLQQNGTLAQIRQRWKLDE